MTKSIAFLFIFGTLHIMKKPLYKRLTHLVYTFYTFRAIALHLGYVFGLLPNTSIIAIVVLVCSQYMFWIWPGYIKKYHGRKNLTAEFILHRLPVLRFRIAHDIHATSNSILLCCLTIVLYIAIHGKDKLIRIYHDNPQTRDSIMSPTNQSP